MEAIPFHTRRFKMGGRKTRSVRLWGNSLLFGALGAMTLSMTLPVQTFAQSNGAIVPVLLLQEKQDEKKGPDSTQKPPVVPPIIVEGTTKPPVLQAPVEAPPF